MTKRDILVEKQRELKNLNETVRKLAKDIDIIIDKHNSYRLGGDLQKVDEWFSSFPIQSLEDSLDYDHGRLNKFSIKSLMEKRRLRKEHDKKLNEFEVARHKRAVVKIELLLTKINNII